MHRETRKRLYFGRLQEMSVMDIESAAEDEEISALPEGFTKPIPRTRWRHMKEVPKPQRRL